MLANLPKTIDLSGTNRCVINRKRLNLFFILKLILVHPNNNVFATINTGLLASRGFFDPQLGHARFNRLGHSAQRFNFFDERPGLVGQFLGQAFHHVAAAPGINHIGNPGFFLNHQLGIARYARGKFGGQRNGFV